MLYLFGGNNDSDTKGSANEISPPEANTNSTGNLSYSFNDSILALNMFYKYMNLLIHSNITASADGTPKKSPTSSSGFHHHVVMTDKSGALNVYVQVSIQNIFDG